MKILVKLYNKFIIFHKKIILHYKLVKKYRSQVNLLKSHGISPKINYNKNFINNKKLIL